MITDEQVMKALDAYYGIEHIGGARESLIEEMRKALEAYEQSKPKPEPAGYAYIVGNQIQKLSDTKLNAIFVPLYTTPPTREPLSEDEVWRIYDEGDNVSSALEFARAVEKAHGIGV